MLFLVLEGVEGVISWLAGIENQAENDAQGPQNEPLWLAVLFSNAFYPLPRGGMQNRTRSDIETGVILPTPTPGNELPPHFRIC